jgi:hypothetical protein
MFVQISCHLVMLQEKENNNKENNFLLLTILCQGPSWLWPYGSWIYNYLCNQCLSPLTLWVRTPLRWGALDTTLCDKVCQWRATGQWFSPSTQVSSNNKTDRRDITEILLKEALSTIKPNQTKTYCVELKCIWKMQFCATMHILHLNCFEWIWFIWMS